MLGKSRAFYLETIKNGLPEKKGHTNKIQWANNKLRPFSARKAMPIKSNGQTINYGPSQLERPCQ
jgi:hypothetical protein